MVSLGLTLYLPSHGISRKAVFAEIRMTLGKFMKDLESNKKKEDNILILKLIYIDMNMYLRFRK